MKFDTLIQIATIISCITTVALTVKKVDAAINKFWADFHRYHMYTLKIAVLSEELPLVDRLHAGEEYIKLGGNGLIKKKYEELVNQALEELSNRESRYQEKNEK